MSYPPLFNFLKNQIFAWWSEHDQILKIILQNMLTKSYGLASVVVRRPLTSSSQKLKDQF